MSAKGKGGDWMAGRNTVRQGKERKGKKKKDLRLHSLLGRPERTNVFDSPEMNFPAVVATAAKCLQTLPTVPRPQRVKDR